MNSNVSYNYTRTSKTTHSILWGEKACQLDSWVNQTLPWCLYLKHEVQDKHPQQTGQVIKKGSSLSAILEDGLGGQAWYTYSNLEIEAERSRIVRLLSPKSHIYMPQRPPSESRETLTALWNLDQLPKQTTTKCGLGSEDINKLA